MRLRAVSLRSSVLFGALLAFAIHLGMAVPQAASAEPLNDPGAGDSLTSVFMACGPVRDSTDHLARRIRMLVVGCGVNGGVAGDLRRRCRPPSYWSLADDPAVVLSAGRQ